MIRVNLDNVPVKSGDKEYLAKDLPADAQDALRQVLDLRRQREELLFKLKQVDIAEHAFSTALDTLVENWEQADGRKSSQSAA